MGLRILTSHVGPDSWTSWFISLVSTVWLWGRILYDHLDLTSVFIAPDYKAGTGRRALVKTTFMLLAALQPGISMLHGYNNPAEPSPVSWTRDLPR